MRQTVNLDGLWRFLPELDPRYHSGDQYADPAWDRRHWDWVPVPGCWNTYAERYAIFEGVAWFARSFELDDWSADRIGMLRFGAVNYAARVYVNGELAGDHVGGYTAFCVDVSPWLRQGQNWIVVKVDDRRHQVLLPACFGWFNYGGIHRSVTLEISEGARLDWLGVQGQPIGQGATCQIRAEIASRTAKDLTLRLAIHDRGGKTLWASSVPAQEVVTVQAHLAQADAWTLDAPALHTLRAVLVGPSGHSFDERTVSFGLRQISTKGSAILLNGEPIWLKGICYMPDHPTTGMAHDDGICARDLDHLTSLGVNALRLHVPAHPALLAECDQRGILVWSEVPIYCLAPTAQRGSAFAQPAYLDLAKNMLREMIRAAYNHPSVAIWSIGNECSVAHPEAPPFFTALADTVRGLDDSRLLAYASLYGAMGEIGDLLDVVGVNEYWGWYDRISSIPGQDKPLLQAVREDADGGRTVVVGPLELERLQQELEAKAACYHKPLLLTEFGADALPGYRSADLTFWSEDYQAEVLRRTFDILSTAEQVSGAFPFLYQDYPDPSKYVDGHWDGVNYKGIVSYSREPKLAAGVLREVYAQDGD